MATVTFSNVEKSFGSTRVIRGLGFDIKEGEFMVLVGPSGCGKSTLLRMLAGLEEITGGTIAIDDKVVNDVESKDRDIAMVFQSYALYPHMTVGENMAFSLKLRKADRKVIDERVAKASKILNLDPYLNRYPRELSGGQRQRVAMGRAIVRDPKVFLFDEPLSNLDAKLRVAMRAEIKALHQRLKTTTVYVTHDQVEAMTMADRIVVMHDGRIEQIGTPLELYDRPCNLFVAEFIGSPAMNVVDGVLAPLGRCCLRRGRRRRALAACPRAGCRRPGGRLRHSPRAPDARRRRRRRAGRSGCRRTDRGRDRAADPGWRGADRAADARPSDRPARPEDRARRRPGQRPSVRSGDGPAADGLTSSRRATSHPSHSSDSQLFASMNRPLP